MTTGGKDPYRNLYVWICHVQTTSNTSPAMSKTLSGLSTALRGRRWTFALALDIERQVTRNVMIRLVNPNVNYKGEGTG